MIGWYIQAKKIPMITPYIESIRKEMLTYRESEQEIHIGGLSMVNILMNLYYRF